jgi:hypothetical protein
MNNGWTRCDRSRLRQGAIFRNRALSSRLKAAPLPRSSRIGIVNVVVTSMSFFLFVCPARGLHASELKPETVKAFDQYVQKAELRISAEMKSRSAFLWVDILSSAGRTAAYARLREGEILVHPFAAGLGIPGGMIHDWLGIAFIPNSSLDETLAQIENYNAYARIYSPEVARAKIVKELNADFTVSLWLENKNLVTQIFDVLEDVQYSRVSSSREYSCAHSIQIFEVGNSETSGQPERPSALGHGYLWKLETYSWFVQTRAGVYMQLEAIALSRSIPRGLGWLIKPFVIKVPRESLMFTLARTRASVTAAATASRASSSVSKKCQHGGIGQTAGIDSRGIPRRHRRSGDLNIEEVNDLHLSGSPEISTAEIGRKLAAHLVNL